MGYLNPVIPVIFKPNWYLPLHLYLVCICISIGLPVFDFLEIFAKYTSCDVKNPDADLRYLGGNDKSIKPVKTGFHQCTMYNAS